MDGTYIFGAMIALDGDDHVVSVRDLPEIVTSGDTLEEALVLASDAIEVAVVGRMKGDMALPEPSPVRNGEHAIALSAKLSAKLAIYAAFKASGMRKTELARRLGRNEI